MAGLTLSQVTARIAATDRSVFSGWRGRAALIARMETYRAYDAAHQRSLEMAQQVLDRPGTLDPLLKRATEFIDARNHPFSPALDGRIAPVNGEWEVPLVEVERHAAAMGRPLGGILWRLDADGVYRGGTYPAHFHDRGRQIPWRASWGGVDRSGGDMKREARDAAAETRRQLGIGEQRPTQPRRRRAEGLLRNRTLPSERPSPAREPAGRPKVLCKRDDDQKRDGIRLENEVARELARRGYRIEQLPERRGRRASGQKNPDYRIEDRVFDHYAPTTANTRGVWTELANKIATGQADRFVLNLARYSGGTLDDLVKQFRENPLMGLVELMVLDGGRTSWLVD